MSGKITRSVVPRFFPISETRSYWNTQFTIFEINSSWLEVKNSFRHQRIDLFILYPLLNPSANKEEY